MRYIRHTCLKRITLLAVLLSGIHIAMAATTSAAIDSIPRPVGIVNDFESLFTQPQRDSLEGIIAAYRQRTTIEIAILTVDAEMTTTSGFDNFTVKVFNVWGIGDNKKNNGVLVAISRSLRKIRIQNGHGIEKVLNNIETKQIIDNEFIPDFRKSRFYEGTLNGLRSIMNRLSS